MSPENVHDRKDNQHFTIVFVPGGESRKTRTLSVSKWGFYTSIPVLVAVIVIGIFSLIVYTPVRSLLPVSNPELEKRYGGQILQIQDEVSRLVEEMNVLRSYNLRLRKALGESVTKEESTLIASHDPTTEQKRAADSESDPAAGSERESAGPDPKENVIRAIPERESGNGSMQAPVAGHFISPRGVRIELPMSKPADGYVTQGFDPVRYHFGMDFAGKKSSAVLAAADGNVVFSGWTYDDGYLLLVSHGQGYLSVYKHNESLLKGTGSTVRRGEPIALLGNTGRTSSGPHLHFEVWKDGIAYDPGQFLLTTQ